MKRALLLSLVYSSLAVPALAEGFGLGGVVTLRQHGHAYQAPYQIADFDAGESDAMYMMDDALGMVMRVANEHFAEMDAGTWPTKYVACVAKRAVSHLYDATRPKEVNASWTMTFFTMAITKHMQSGTPIRITPYYDASSQLGYTYVGRVPGQEGVDDLYLNVNRYRFTHDTVSTERWANTIFHEMLHRLGLTHPEDLKKYPGTLIRAYK